MEDRNSAQVPPASPAPPVGVPPVVEVVPPQVEQPQTPGKFSLSPKIMLIILAILIIAVVGSGIYLSQSYQPKSTPTPTPTVASKPTPTPNLTASWKTFVDQSLKISFEYPRDWQVEKDETGGYRIKPLSYKGSDLVINISFYENQNSLSLAEFDVELDSKKSSTRESSEKSDLSKNNISIKTSQSIDAFYRESFICPPLTCSRYIIPYKDKIYIIANLNQPVVDNQSEIFKEVFSTFKFTDSNQSPSSNLPISSEYPIVSSSKTSPNSSFTITEKQQAESNFITIKNSEGVVITDDLLAKNNNLIIDSMPSSGCACSFSFKGWIDNSQFVLEVGNIQNEQFEYIVEASTAKVNESSFRRTK